MGRKRLRVGENEILWKSYPSSGGGNGEKRGPQFFHILWHSTLQAYANSEPILPPPPSHKILLSYADRRDAARSVAIKACSAIIIKKKKHCLLYLLVFHMKKGNPDEITWNNFFFCLAGHIFLGMEIRTTFRRTFSRYFLGVLKHLKNYVSALFLIKEEYFLIWTFQKLISNKLRNT